VQRSGQARPRQQLSVHRHRQPVRDQGRLVPPGGPGGHDGS